ncbi:MAG: DUF4417 domain-containing protein [Bacteroidaceae bacterium]|nr:DUF4417 domain-containing protein [Bacteroidaceae bacterium]
MNKDVFQECLFPEFEEEPLQQKAKISPHDKWLSLRSKNFGLEYCCSALFSGKYGIPLLNAYTASIPKSFITFGELSSTGDPNSCVTGFDNDYIIDRLWTAPNRYIEKLSRYQCMAEPDYSLKVNHPLSLQIANTFRSHAVSYYMQEHGIMVLPTISWSSTPSFDFCFDGHSKGGAVLVSTIGVLRDERSRMYFHIGFNEMLKRISPDAVILYGDVNEEIMSWMPKHLEIIHVCHNRFKRARNYGR